MKASVVLASCALLAGGALVGGTAAGARGIDHKVSVGSSDGTPWGPGGDANFSLVANERAADGSVSGQWHDQFGKNGSGNGEGVHVDVNCLEVSGHDAWVSGIVTHASPGFESWVGKPALTRVRDNGTSQQDPEDQISYTYQSSISCHARPNLTLFDINGGQVTVR